jgi:hypothetical protein
MKIKIDKKDLHLFYSRTWSVNRGRGNYVQSSVKNKTVMLHRLIMKPAAGLIVDHINGDPLDNRRANLRVCKQADNVKNNRKLRTGKTSKYKGVYWMTSMAKWAAQIKSDNKTSYLGCFELEVDAALAYNNAAKILHGEFAALNEINY